MQVVFLVAVPIAFVAFLLELPAARGGAAQDGADGRPRRGARGARSTGRRSRRSSWRSQRLSDRENRGELYQHAGPAGRHRPAAPVGLAALPAGRPARRASVGEVADRLKVDPEVIQPGGGRAGVRRHDRGARARGAECDLHLTAAGTSGARQADRGAPDGADRAARRVEPRGAPRDHRDGEGARPRPAGRRRAAGGGRHAAAAARPGPSAVAGAEVRRRRSVAGREAPVAVFGRSRGRWGPCGVLGSRGARRAQSGRRPMASSPMSAAPRTGGASRRTRTALGAAAWTPAATRSWNAVSAGVEHAPAEHDLDRLVLQVEPDDGGPDERRRPRRPGCRPPRGPARRRRRRHRAGRGPARRGGRTGWRRCRCP